MPELLWVKLRDNIQFDNLPSDQTQPCFHNVLLRFHNVLEETSMALELKSSSLLSFEFPVCKKKEEDKRIVNTNTQLSPATWY